MCVCVFFFRSLLFFLWIAGWKRPDIRPRASGNRKACTRLFLFPLSKLVELTRKSDEAQRAFPASFSVPRHRQQASYENFVFYQSNMNIFQFHGSLNTFASTLLERISKRIETKILSFGTSPKASYFFFIVRPFFIPYYQFSTQFSVSISSFLFLKDVKLCEEWDWRRGLNRIIFLFFLNFHFATLSSRTFRSRGPLEGCCSLILFLYVSWIFFFLFS